MKMSEVGSQKSEESNLWVINTIFALRQACTERSRSAPRLF